MTRKPKWMQLVTFKCEIIFITQVCGSWNNFIFICKFNTIIMWVAKKSDIHRRIDLCCQLSRLVTTDIHAYQVSFSFYTLILSHFSRLWVIAIPCEEIHMMPRLSALLLVRKKGPLKSVTDSFASRQNHIQTGIILLSCLQPCYYTFISPLGWSSHCDPIFPSSLSSSPPTLAVGREKWAFSSGHSLKVRRILLNSAVKISWPLFIPLQKDNMVTFKAWTDHCKMKFSTMISSESTEAPSWAFASPTQVWPLGKRCTSYWWITEHICKGNIKVIRSVKTVMIKLYMCEDGTWRLRVEKGWSKWDLEYENITDIHIFLESNTGNFCWSL